MSAEASDTACRCRRCGAPIPEPNEYLTLHDIMRRYKVARTKALDLRREVRHLFPDAVLRHGRCVRVAASALDRIWERD